MRTRHISVILILFIACLPLCECMQAGTATPSRDKIEGHTGHGQNTRTFTQAKARPLYENRNGHHNVLGNSHVSTTPVLRPYVKWTLPGFASVYGGGRVTDGEYLYMTKMKQGARFKFKRTPPAIDIVRISLRTMEEEVLVRGKFISGVYLNGGRFYAVAPDGIYCFRKSDGKQLWKYRTADARHQRLPLLILDDRVMVCTGRGIICLDKKDGTKMWERVADGNLGFGERVPPAFECAGLVVSWRMPKADAIIAIDPDTGKIVWKVKRPEGQNSWGIASDGERVFLAWATFATGNEIVIAAHDAGTGNLQWRRTLKDFNTRTVSCITFAPGFGVAVSFPRPRKRANDPFICDYVFLDPRTGETVRKYENLHQLHYYQIGDWFYGVSILPGKLQWNPPTHIAKAYNLRTGESIVLLDTKEEPAKRGTRQGILPPLDGYLRIVGGKGPLGGPTKLVCLEDMRFHPDAAKLLFDRSPEFLDQEMRARIAKLIEKTGDEDFETKQEARRELESLMDLPEEQLKIAARQSEDSEVRYTVEQLLKGIEHWKDLRKYLEKFNCRRDPIYFTTLIRHTADLEIQKKAIKRLKKITGEDFGLEPSKHWIEDQKDASDKYDEWWFKNRKELKWSGREDRYLPTENEEEE